ncbi:MAG: nitronate monooxygenase [Alphaproteobacteria bacterium]|nr:nitronate monooxygenase [Alphaproteobacteria bacterium]MCW5741667.1 nitronate monooxygenase [Alphaproteobacteria bacterium]
MWSDRRFIDLVDIEHPILLAPMAGSGTPALGAAVSEAGGLGSLACAMLNVDQIRSGVGVMRQRTDKPINVNFFVHQDPVPDAAREAGWRKSLGAYYAEFGIDPSKIAEGPGRAPFDEAACELMVELKPKVVSFHFGLPERRLFERVKSAGCITLSSATTVEEARWLEDHGVDAVIAQGNEAGGHRGMFLTEDVAAQPGTFALVPQIADAVKVPVIAAGGIADSRGVVAALALGASAVQIGTAYLFCDEAGISPIHRAALKSARADQTALTNVFTGRPARGLLNRVMREQGPISPHAPAFPLATSGIGPLRAAAEAKGSGDFSPLWSGQAASLGQGGPAAEFTRKLIEGARERMKSLAR